MSEQRVPPSTGLNACRSSLPPWSPHQPGSRRCREEVVAVRAISSGWISGDHSQRRRLRPVWRGRVCRAGPDPQQGGEIEQTMDALQDLRQELNAVPWGLMRLCAAVIVGLDHTTASTSAKRPETATAFFSRCSANRWIGGSSWRSRLTTRASPVSSPRFQSNRTVPGCNASVRLCP